MKYERIPPAQAREALKGFDDWLPPIMERWEIPGVAIAVIADNEVIHSAGYGYRDVERKLPVTPETLFAIGSCSKAFTTFGLGLLVEDKRLDWDRPVQHDLPGFRLQDPVASAQATPRDLALHRVGLGRHDLAWYGSSRNREQLFEALPHFASNLGFRFSFQYNNWMYMTAGYLTGQVSRMSWEDFTHQRIFEPLGMTHSQFSVQQSEQSANAALPYSRIAEVVQRVPFRNLDAIGPAGSINSNLVDLIPWLMLHLNQGQHNGQSIISPAGIKAMHTPGVITTQPLEAIWNEYAEMEHNSYGLGWGVQSYRGYTSVWHGGAIDGFLAMMSFMPHQGIGVIVLTNLFDHMPPSIIRLNLLDRLLGLEPIDWSGRFAAFKDKLKGMTEEEKAKAQSKRIAGTQPAHALADYAGVYEHPGYGALEIQSSADGLRAVYNGHTFTVEHFHYDTFQIRNTILDLTLPASFTTGMDGALQDVAIPLEPTTDPIRFTRRATQ